MVWASVHTTANPKPGELTIATGAYISVFDDYRIWSKLPYIDGSYIGYWDGSNAAGGTTWKQFPIANAGGARVKFETGGAASFDLDGADSAAMWDEGYLGQLTAYNTPTAISASSENGANVDDNAFDGDSGTYWEATSSAAETIQWTAANQSLRRISITAESSAGAPQSFNIQRYNTYYGWVTINKVTGETGWSIGENRSFFCDCYYPDVGSWQAYRLSIGSSNGGNIAIREIAMHNEDRVTTSPYTWSIASATYTTGSNTSEAPTVSLPIGFRYAELSVEDAASTYTGETHTPILVSVKDPSNNTIDLSGATATSSTGTDPEDAIDGNTGTAWTGANGVTSGWLKVDMSAGNTARISEYRLSAYGVTGAPDDWILEGSDDDATYYLIDKRESQSFSVAGVETQTFTLYNAVHEYRYYKLTINSLQAGTRIQLYEFAPHFDETPYAPITLFNVTEQRHGQQGQRMTLDVLENISYEDYPPGTLALYWEEETMPAAYYQAVTLVNEAALLAHWPLWDVSGASVAEDLSANGYDGTPTAVTFGSSTGMGDGNTSASFNGAASYIDYHSAGLESDFDADTGTLSTWVYIEAGVWVDSTSRRIAEIRVDTNNRIAISKGATNYTIVGTYYGGGTPVSVSATLDATTRANFANVLLTWNTGTDTLALYINGVLIDSASSLGTWAGTPGNIYIGAYNSTPLNPFEGDIAHVALYDEVLSQFYISQLATATPTISKTESLSAAGPDGHTKMWGWLDIAREQIRGRDTGREASTRITVLDAAGRLAQLPGFPFVIEHDNTGTLPAYYNQMAGACIDRLIYLLGRWCSSAAEVTDFIISGSLSLWVFPILEVSGADLWEMMRGRAEAAEMRLGITKHGAIKWQPDFQMLDFSVLSTLPDATIDIDSADWLDIRYTNTPTPRLHWGWAAAVQTAWEDPASASVTAYRCVTPGDAPGQGLRSAEQNEMLVTGQSNLNKRAGQLYAYENAPFSRFTVELAHAADTGLDPGDMQYIAVTISSEEAARRGLTWTSEKMWLYELEYRHLPGNVKEVRIQLEDYIDGGLGDAIS